MHVLHNLPNKLSVDVKRSYFWLISLELFCDAVYLHLVAILIWRLLTVCYAYPFFDSYFISLACYLSKVFFFFNLLQ